MLSALKSGDSFPGRSPRRPRERPADDDLSSEGTRSLARRRAAAHRKRGLSGSLGGFFVEPVLGAAVDAEALLRELDNLD